MALLLPLARRKGDKWIARKALTAMLWGVGGFCYVERAIFRILGLILGMMSHAKKDLFLATLKCHSGPPPSPITLIPLFFEFLHPKIGGGGVPNPNPTPAGGSLGGGVTCRLVPYIHVCNICGLYPPPPVLGAPLAPPRASSLASLARITCPCARVNGMVGPLPQYWHFASTWEDSVYLGRPRLPGADRVYTLQTAIPMCTGKWC